MIVITFKGDPSPMIGKARGWGVVSDTRAPSVANAIENAMLRFANERDGFIYVASGAKVHSSKVSPAFREKDWDVAVHVDRIGSRPLAAQPFSGIGRVLLDTILVRRTAGAVRAMARWAERNEISSGRESINLAITLAEMKDVKVLHLPSEWVWRDDMRAVFPMADPVIEFRPNVSRSIQDDPPKISTLVSSALAPNPEKVLGPGVLWVGHLYQYTGYGKANREILFRVANSMSVRIDDAHKEPCYVREDLRARLDVHRNILVAPRAPLLRMMGPDHISQGVRHRIVWTMQETSVRVHEDMVKRANANFDEIWTPSQWNLDVFEASGIRLHGRVMPLGIDSAVFRPGAVEKLPPCRLISTSKRGKMGVPKGFVFLTVGLPGFRKGWDVIANAAERAFKDRRNVNIVIALTHSPPAWNEKVYKQFARYKVPIWTLEGSFDESQMAKIYRGSNAYVSASRGEGFNLPAAEAAACGIPVIVPNNTCHTEIFGPEGFTFDPEGEKAYPEGDWISKWYVGQLFSNFGKRSTGQLAGLLEHVHGGGSEIFKRAKSLHDKIVSRYTWDIAAARATKRLLDVQP